MSVEKNEIQRVDDAVAESKRILLKNRVQQFTGADVVALADIILRLTPSEKQIGA